MSRELVEEVLHAASSGGYPVPWVGDDPDFDPVSGFEEIRPLELEVERGLKYRIYQDNGKFREVEFKISISKFNLSRRTDYVKYNIDTLTDYYQYEAKLDAYNASGNRGYSTLKRQGMPPRRVWNNPTYRGYMYPIVRGAILTYSPGAIDIYSPQFRSHLFWQLKSSKMFVSSYSPAYMVTLIHLLRTSGVRINSLFDPFAGWGDRLLGAMRLKIPYTGCDPNPNLLDGYANMMREFGSGCEPQVTRRGVECGEYNIYSSPFEDLDINRKFDAIITSPPYGEVEVYDVQGASQSTSRYSSRDMWFRMYESWMVKMSGMVNRGGCIVVQVNDSPNINLVLRTIDGVTKTRECEYIGNYCTQTKNFNNNNLMFRRK